MVPYTISPYVTFIENRLFPGVIQYGVFHRLTGEVVEPSERVHSLLLTARLGSRISIRIEDLHNFGEEGAQLRELAEKAFLIPFDSDPLVPFVNQLVLRPMQNPALAYRATDAEMWLVRTSMAHRVYSPRRDELPEVIEEAMPQFVADIFLRADGTRTLEEIVGTAKPGQNENILARPGLREAVNFLTSAERQLVKFTSRNVDLVDPFQPFNTVPRNFYHSSRWDVSSRGPTPSPIGDFHLHGIEDADWEFDQIEPTLNHAFRYPSEALAGQEYGARFCDLVLSRDVLPLLDELKPIKVLEVGGGTGTFAKSFIERGRELSETGKGSINLDYHILELSPALMQSQRQVLGELMSSSNHFQQDATELHLPNRKFDLIIANEVVADFPVAMVQRGSLDDSPNGEAGSRPQSENWHGEGAHYLEKYGLDTRNAPDRFLINSGAVRFIERAWEHLSPGGALIITEYGAAERYPVQSYHLNHEEYSVHFGHLKTCATKAGFACRLFPLKEFLEVNDQIPVLDGREEHIMCLNYVLQKHGKSLPYAVISKSAFENQFQEIGRQLELIGVSFSPLANGYHFGPRIEDFMILIMNKPR